MTRIIIENVDMLNRCGGRHGPRLDPDAKLALLHDLHQVDVTMHRSDVSETMGRASALVGKLAEVIQGEDLDPEKSCTLHICCCCVELTEATQCEALNTKH
jgi:hypothetical protein